MLVTFFFYGYNLIISIFLHECCSLTGWGACQLGSHLWENRRVKDKSHGWQHKVSLWPGLRDGKGWHCNWHHSLRCGTVRGDSAETVLMSEWIPRHLFSKAFPSKMEDRPSQSVKPATNKSGYQTEKWQMEGAYKTLVHPALTAADQKATKDHCKRFSLWRRCYFIYSI